MTSAFRTFNCTECGVETSIQPCASCRQTEQLRKQTELLERSAREDKLHREHTAYLHRQSFLQAQAEQRAYEEELARREQQRQRESDLLLKFAIENKTSDAEAYDLGYSWDFIRLPENARALENTVDEDGVVRNLFYKKPYTSLKLNAAFNLGVWQRLRDEINDAVRFDLESQVRAQASEGVQRIRVAFAPGFLGGRQFTFNRDLAVGYMQLDRSTGKKEFIRYDEPVLFQNPSLNAEYLTAFRAWQKKAVRRENSPSKVEERLAEIRKAEHEQATNARKWFRIRAAFWCTVSVVAIYGVIRWI